MNFRKMQTLRKAVVPAVLFGALLRCGLTPEALHGAAFGLILYAAAEEDLTHCRIPDRVTGAGAALWVLDRGMAGLPAGTGLRLLTALLVAGCLLALALVMDRLLGRKSLGGGDIKLLFVINLHLSLPQLWWCLLLSCLFALAGFRGTGKRQIPLAPAFAAAAWLSLLFG